MQTLDIFLFQIKFYTFSFYSLAGGKRHLNELHKANSRHRACVKATEISPYVSDNGTLPRASTNKAQDPWTIFMGSSREGGRGKRQGPPCYFYPKREIPLRKWKYTNFSIFFSQFFSPSLGGNNLSLEKCHLHLFSLCGGISNPWKALVSRHARSKKTITGVRWWLR